MRRTDEEIVKSLNARAHVGGGYFNPVEGFLSVGRQLSTEDPGLLPTYRMQQRNGGEPTYEISALWNALTDMLGADELLFGAYDRGSYWLAAHIVDEERLMEFELEVVAGRLRRKGYYALEFTTATAGLVTPFEVPRA